jgi:hypothetical protein
MALPASRPFRAFENLQPFYGDLHNHCDLSYGHGTLAEALQNARLQLDFASVTVHAVWPDLPTDDPKLAYLVDYHRQGFLKAQANWPRYREVIDHVNADGDFVTFPSFEWHSIAYGDYCVYYKQAAENPIIDAPDLPALRQTLRELGTPSLLIPHHIGYKQGSRGINWQAFTGELSPVVEIFSFHGLSETSEGPYPYLHSMGPRHEQSTAQYGWSLGKRFGVIGSTDHHNAFPGSYGYGRLGVWADNLSRDAIWDAIKQRRTYALTGDRIELAFAINDVPMGGVAGPDSERQIEVDVCAGGSIDYIDVLHNNRVIHRENVLPQPGDGDAYKVYIEMGWAEQDEPFPWDVSVQVENGRLLDVEPRFRGYGPTATATGDTFAYASLEQSDGRIRLQTLTHQNPALHTAATEGVSLEIAGDASTVLATTFNGQQQRIPLGDLFTGSRTFYTGQFVSPAICFHRAAPLTEYSRRFTLAHQGQTSQTDWYYVRVRQTNNQWAWSSPVWVEAAPD